MLHHRDTYLSRRAPPAVVGQWDGSKSGPVKQTASGSLNNLSPLGSSMRAKNSDNEPFTKSALPAQPPGRYPDELSIWTELPRCRSLRKRRRPKYSLRLGAVQVFRDRLSLHRPERIRDSPSSTSRWPASPL